MHKSEITAVFLVAVLLAGALVSGPFFMGEAQASSEKRDKKKYQDDYEKEDRYAEDQYEMDSYEKKDPYAKDPYAKDPYAKDPYAKDPYAKDPYAVDPYAKDPYAVDPYAQPAYAAPAAYPPVYPAPVYPPVEPVVPLEPIECPITGLLVFDIANCPQEPKECPDGLLVFDLANCPVEEPPVPPVEICNDGIDNDGDLLIDTADPDCANPPPNGDPLLCEKGSELPECTEPQCDPTTDVNCLTACEIDPADPECGQEPPECAEGIDANGLEFAFVPNSQGLCVLEQECVNEDTQAFNPDANPPACQDIPVTCPATHPDYNFVLNACFSNNSGPGGSNPGGLSINGVTLNTQKSNLKSNSISMNNAPDSVNFVPSTIPLM